MVIAVFVGCMPPASGQSYNYDLAKVDQVLLMEGVPGGNMLNPLLDAIYYLPLSFDPEYISDGEISLKNKMAPRYAAYGSVVTQKEFAAQMDTVYKKRSEVELVNLVDRDPGCSVNPVGDVAWDIEGDKLREAQKSFKRNISILGDLDGVSPAVIRDWNSQYNILTQAVKEMQQSYMPNSKRQQQYLKIYQEMLERNRSLAALIQSYSYQSLIGDAQAEAFELADRRAIAKAAVARWMSNYKK